MARWSEFRRRYREELHSRPRELTELRSLSAEGRVTFVNAARDERHNSALLLREVVEEQGR